MTKHLFIGDNLDEAMCRKRAEIIWAARKQNRETPEGIDPSIFSDLKKQVGGVKKLPQNGLLCVNLGQLQQLVALIEQCQGRGKVYRIPSGTIVMMSQDSQKCWTSTTGGQIVVEIEVIGNTYQVWHCENMIGNNQVEHPW